MPKIAKRYKAYDDPNFNKIALVIGHICIQWSRVEDIVDSFIEIIASLEEGNISRSITSNIDIRNKIQTLKALAFQKKVSDSWFKDLNTLLDHIDNEIRPERNKYVHSHWFVPQGRLVRVSRRIKFKKPQAFQLNLTTEERLPVNIRDARRFCEKLDETFIDLFEFYRAYFWSPMNPKRPESDKNSDGP
ncbi:hypothetical protein [Bradyrhizobium sp.]